MTDAERTLAGMITAAPDAWLPLALLAPGWLDAADSLVSAGLAEYWPGSPDGPAVTLTARGAELTEKEIHERVEKRAVTVEADDGAWWAGRPVRRRTTRRNEVVPKWGPAGKARPVAWPQHCRESPLWFPESVPDHRPGPAEEAEAREDEAARAVRELTANLFTGGAVEPVPGLAGGVGPAVGKAVPAPVSRRIKRKKAKRVRRAG